MGFEFAYESPRDEHLLVVHDDDRVITAYLHATEGIISDVWLSNVFEAPEEFVPEPKRDRPPVNPRRYCSDEPMPRIESRKDIGLDGSTNPRDSRRSSS